MKSSSDGSRRRFGSQAAKGEELPSRFEARIGRITIWLILIIVPIVIVDFVSPAFLSHRRSEIEKRYPVQVIRKPRPYVMFGGEGNAQIEGGERLNDLGFRGNSPSGEKKAGEYRIFMLGGSTVFAGEPPIPELLEREFRQAGHDNVKVFNFGVVSSVSSMELARIVFEISDHRPDLIVMYNGGNDIFQPYEYDPRPGYPFNYLVYERNPLLESDVKTYPAVQLFLYGSNLARRAFRKQFTRSLVRLDETREETGYRSKQWQEEIANVYVANIVKAQKVSAAFGAEFLAFLQPMLCFKDTLTQEEKGPERKGQEFEEFREHCLYVRERIRELARARQVEGVFVDISDIYDDTTETVFKDVVHTYQERKGAVAKEMYRNIVDRLAFGRDQTMHGDFDSSQKTGQDQ